MKIPCNLIFENIWDAIWSIFFIWKLKLKNDEAGDKVNTTATGNEFFI